MYSIYFLADVFYFKPDCDGSVVAQKVKGDPVFSPVFDPLSFWCMLFISNSLFFSVTYVSVCVIFNLNFSFYRCSVNFHIYDSLVQILDLIFR